MLNYIKKPFLLLILPAFSFHLSCSQNNNNSSLDIGVPISGVEGTIGNGGDPCELKINSARMKIKDFYSENVDPEFTYRVSDAAETYRDEMLKFLEGNKVSIQCTNQVLTNASGHIKTCINFLSQDDGVPVIKCTNAKIFSQVPKLEQIALIHHEYASLANYESDIPGDGSSSNSDYFYSNQFYQKLQQEDPEKKICYLELFHVHLSGSIDSNLKERRPKHISLRIGPEYEEPGQGLTRGRLLGTGVPPELVEINDNDGFYIFKHTVKDHCLHGTYLCHTLASVDNITIPPLCEFRPRLIEHEKY